MICLDEKPVSLHGDAGPLNPAWSHCRAFIHCRKSLTDHLGDEEGRYVRSRLKVHYTPKHGGWLNQAEIEGIRLIPQLDLLATRQKEYF